MVTRVGSRLVYLDAPIPPMGPSPETDARLAAVLVGMVASAGATILGTGCFSLASYLSAGNPIAGGAIGGVARVILERLVPKVRQPAKVLVTDFDNTLWAGVLSEDGEQGIAYQASGRGFRHFLYQTLLARLKASGALVAGVTRNSASVVQPVLDRGEMVLKSDDFVAVLASYHAKSSQIEALAKRLNLGLDAFVFVDDNEVELEEVTRALPAVRSIRFPSKEEDLPALLEQLSLAFARDQITEEDRDRTLLYRRRLDGIVPEEASGADIGEFLASLRMRLELTDRSQGDRARVVQLINKTNQFNLNGRRWTDEDVATVLATGGRLLGATLTDRSGSHGEIIAFLVTATGVVEAWVMSCRVFQRRVEHAFLLAALARGTAVTGFRFAATERNEPMRQFLRSLSGQPGDGVIAFDPTQFRAKFGSDGDLFEVAG
jgi:FkbH-like protein